jgi:hypothetical protein
MLTRAKDMGVAKVNAVSEYGRDKLIQAAKATYTQRALQNLDSAVTTVDNYVDKYIPLTDQEDGASVFSVPNTPYFVNVILILIFIPCFRL